MVLPACSKSSTATRADSVVILTIKDFAFSPKPVTVAAGTALEVSNVDTTTHTVTADDKSFDTGHIAAGARRKLTLRRQGTFGYHCDIHNYMTGVIQVHN